MDADERRMLLDAAADQLAAGKGSALLADLAGSGYADELWSDAQAWTGLARLHGRLGAAPDSLSAASLHGSGSGASALVLPVPGCASSPGACSGADLQVDGLVFGVAGPATVAVPCDDGRIAEVPTDLLQLAAVDGLDVARAWSRLSGTVGTGAIAFRDAAAPPVLDRARRYLAHLLLGVGAAALELAQNHVRERRQFGQPLGAFQAVRHRLAEAHIQLSGATAAVAATTARTGSASALIEKVLAGNAALQGVAAAQQVCGGMGFTWEFGLHTHVRAAYFYDALCGGSESLVLEVGQLPHHALLDWDTLTEAEVV